MLPRPGSWLKFFWKAAYNFKKYQQPFKKNILSFGLAKTAHLKPSCWIRRGLTRGGDGRSTGAINTPPLAMFALGKTQ